MKVGRSYDISWDPLFVVVGPSVDAGKRLLFHGKATAKAIPRGFGSVRRRGIIAEGGSEEYEGPRKPVLYSGIHLLYTLMRIMGKSNDP